MAVVTRDPNGVYIDTSTAMFAAQISGLLLGANVNSGAPCYVKAADGNVYPSDGVAANEAAKFDGFTPRAGVAGQAITLFGIGARFHYAASAGLTPGQDLFIASGGGLDTAATTGGVRAIARAIDDTDIRVTKNSDQA
jgi:hypothetical protein